MAAQMRPARQLRLLLWKDYLIRKRKLVTVVGVLWAIAVVLSLYIVRININNEDFPTCQYVARALPSAGLITFLQSFICNLKNECSPLEKYEQIPTYENSKLTQLQRQYVPLLYNETVLNVAETVPDALKLLATLSDIADEPSFIHISKNGLKVKDLFLNPVRVSRYLSTKLNITKDVTQSLLNAEISFQGIMKGQLDRCNPRSLSDVLIMQNPDHVNILVNRFCSLTNGDLQRIFMDLIMDINFTKYIKMFANMYNKLTGDGRLEHLGDLLKAVLRITRLQSFVPPELMTIFQGGEVDFTYYNISIISKVMDLFEPTFGDTEIYKTLRDFTDSIVVGVQYLNKFFKKPDGKNVVLANVGDLGTFLEDRNKAIEQIMTSDSDIDVYDVFSKVTNLIYKMLPKNHQHDVLLYSTLLTKLFEGAQKVIEINMNIEDMAYNASLRNPDGVEVLMRLPPGVIAKGFEALSDAERTQILTSKLNFPGQMFCDINRIQGFFVVSKSEAESLKSQLCTEAWKNYITDLIRSFGIYEVKNNINEMASLLIQETLGRDTSSQLYTLDKDFKVIKYFFRTLSNNKSKKSKPFDWNTLLKIKNDSDFLKVIREKRHLDNQILITVHGALAKEVVKQNIILDYKITPLLVDLTKFIQAVNEQLSLTPVRLIAKLKELYPDILEILLETALDEDKTYRSLSTSGEKIFCKGKEEAAKYLTFPSNVDLDDLLTTLCNATLTIDNALNGNSIIQKAIQNAMNRTSSTEEVNWTKLINGIKKLHITIERDHPYFYDFSSYGMEVDRKTKLENMFKTAKHFWFNRNNIQKSLHLSIKLVMRTLDVMDQIFSNVTNEDWLKTKYTFNLMIVPVTICDELIKLLTALSKNETYSSDLPQSTVKALAKVLPNLPNLLMDVTKIIVDDTADIDKIKIIMNAVPSWPCSNTSLADVLTLSGKSKIAVMGLETLLCMNRDFQEEWISYLDSKNASNLLTQKWNSTTYKPHTMLKFSSIFDDLITDTIELKNSLQIIFNDKSNRSQEHVTFLSAWNYAMDAFNTSKRDSILRNSFSKVDAILNSVLTPIQNNISLNMVWEKYLSCNGTHIEEECRNISRAGWLNSLKFISVTSENIASDLLTYFGEINEPDSNLLQILGFTKKTGLYILYDKLPEFIGALLNSYWDYGFMTQIRRAANSPFWDCEAVLTAIVPPPGSSINAETIDKVKHFICPSLLHWLSLPRGDNTLLDLISKSQYFFYTIEIQNLTSNYESAYSKVTELTDLLKNVTIKNNTSLEDIKPNGIQRKFEEYIKNVFSYKLNANDTSYRLFNDINHKQYTATIYLTRIVAMVNKFSTVFDNIKLNEIIQDNPNDTAKKVEADLSTIQKIFKRRPSEALAFHFDLITDILWRDDNVTLVESLDLKCLDNMTENILNENERLKKIICSKNYQMVYGTVEKIFEDDYEAAKRSLLKLVTLLDKEDEVVTNISDFFNKRKQLVDSLKYSLKYSYDLSIPIYLKYLQSNLEHYNIVLTFLSGQNWWDELRTLYNGPKLNHFFDTLEKSFDIADDFLLNLDKIHLVRLLRDINVNDTESLCLPNITLSEYIPDSTGSMEALRRDMCDVDSSELYKEFPPLRFASQGFDNELKISREVHYKDIEATISMVEAKLAIIKDGPKSPATPKWITEEKLAHTKDVALRLLSKDTLTKISFGFLSNIVDGATLFLNNSQCTLCSRLTSWMKQINLQLYKKQEYDSLLCHIHDITLEEIHLTLKNDFHWDMAFKELISSRNYTKYELNKSLNEFLEITKLHLLDDVTASSTKITECLIRNVTKNSFGNATLFANVLAKTTRLLRAELPHLQRVQGITDLQFLKQLAVDVAHNLNVQIPLNEYLNEGNSLSEELKDIVGDVNVIHLIKNSKVNVRATRDAKVPEIVKSSYKWSDVCSEYNCSDILKIINLSVNKTLLSNQLSKLQTEEFWKFNFVSDILVHVENLLEHVARMLGVVSKMDIDGVAESKLSAMLDFTMQLLTDRTVTSVLYSLQGVVNELSPILNGTILNFDLSVVGEGLTVLHQYKNDLVQRQDLKLAVSTLFSNPENLELGLSRLGINNTNFWSIAAPRIHAGHIDLRPVISSNPEHYHISSFVCDTENMSQVLLPSNLDEVVTAEDVYAAVIDQFCNLSDDQAKAVIPVLVSNLNFTFLMEKITETLLSQLYAASNLTEAEGANVLERYSEMTSLLPLVQTNVGNLTESLAEEPLFQSLQNFDSIGGLLSSPKFLSGAGNMMCGKPFPAQDNRFYKAIAETEDFSTEPDPSQLEVLPTEFCRSMYKDILKMGGGKIIWSFVKPLIMGKILYTPDTLTVRKIIQKANRTFAEMSRLSGLVGSFGGALQSAETVSRHREGAAALRRALASPALRPLTGSLLPTNDDADADMDMDELFTHFGDMKDIGRLLSKASDLLQCVNFNRFVGTRDEQELTHEAVKLVRINEFSAGLVFLNVEEENNAPINVEYKIRMDIENVPTTARIRNQFWTPGPEADFLQNMRYFRGFLQIQDLIDKAIVQLAHNSSKRIQKRQAIEEQLKEPQWAIYTQQTPYPCYRKDYFQSSLYESQALIVAFFFALVFTVSSAVRFIVSDKENGNTMLMSVMGVNVSSMTFSWFIASLVEVTVTCLCVLAVLVSGAVTPRTDPLLLFLLLFIFGFSVLMFSYMLSKLFKSASVASVCAALAYLISFMPFVIILSLEAALSHAAKIVTCLSMSTSFSYALLYVARLEAEGVGAQWSHLWRPLAGDGDMTMGLAAIMMIVDGLIYFVIGYTIDRFFGLKTLRSNISRTNTGGEKEGVSIVNISKTYGEGSRCPKLALDNVSVELHKGQITTLLGHNGAGKTTLTKILTGMLKPTRGHIVMRSERKSDTHIGVCPQRDVLFEYMTAKEHIALYAQLKNGLPYEDVREEVESMCEALSLGAHLNSPAHTLSGGTRRRVCVALAFVGHAPLVVLDEPTAGVDPAARRDIWSLIMKLKKERIVLLTTHHLDEAELLSDQIVIMHKGQIHTIGSPIEIKRSLGNGYKLSVTFPNNGNTVDEPWNNHGDEESSLEENTKIMLSEVREVIKNAYLVETEGRDLEIMLPFYDANGLNNDFLKLCTSLEVRKSELGFEEFSLECSSLEQVFFNICDRAENTHEVDFSNVESDDTQKSRSSSSIRNDLSPLVESDGVLKASPWQQFLALLHARYLHYIRNRWLLLMLIVMPSVFVIIAMSFSMIRPPPDNEIALRLNPDLYKDTTQFLVPNTETQLAQRVTDAIRNNIQDVRNWTEQDSLNCRCGVTRQTCDITNHTLARPQMMQLPNATTLNDWILTSQDNYMEKRYGGYSSSFKNNITNLIVWYNNKGHHATPAFLNGLNAAILRAVAGPSANITTYSHPLKISQEQLSKSTIYQHVADAGVSSLLLVAYSLVVAGGAIYIVTARTTQQKRLQLLTGVSPLLYNTLALFWDLIIILINIAITAVVLKSFGFPVFVERNNLPAICLLLLLFGFAGGCMVHLCERVFTEASMANMVLFCGNMFVGIAGITILLILDIISESDETDYARWILHKVFLLSPQFALGDALLEIAKNTVQAQVLTRFGMDTYKDPFSSELILYHCVALILVGAVLFVLNLALEYDYFQWMLDKVYSADSEITEAPNEDIVEAPETASERKRVYAALTQREAERTLTLRTVANINAGFVDTEGNKVLPTQQISQTRDVAACVALTKRYTTLVGARHALKGLTLGIPPGQCTVLLGENGAGKSTTFSILSGETRPTSGSVYLLDEPASQRQLCSGLISYCPQSDALDGLLTVRETLELYCKLRGITEYDEVIDRALESVEVARYSSVATRTLSGGNRRKLCAAVALTSRSRLVLLDEPTSGMDPRARVCVARAVRAAARGDRALLLSTHALRDARALHTARVALLHRAKLVALAPLHQCLNRFGGGYVVSCRVRMNSRGTVAAWVRVRSLAPHALLRAAHQDALQFLVPSHATVDNKEINTSLSDIFRLMAELQGTCDVEDYTIDQSSLDQMFLNCTNKCNEDMELLELEPLPSPIGIRNSEELNSITAL